MLLGILPELIFLVGLKGSHKEKAHLFGPFFLLASFL